MWGLARPAVAIFALAAALAGCGSSSPSLAASPKASGARGQNSAPATATQPGTADVATIARRADVPVLCFHQVRDWRPTDSSSDRGIITPLAAFRHQMDFLAQQGYHPVTEEAFYQHLVADGPLPPKPVLLTFDDGSEVQFTNAFPVLAAHHFPATFFPMTIVLNKPHWMTDAQLRQLDAAGITIGNHTYDHEPVTRYSGAAFQKELVDPRLQISRILGHPVVDFAYPYGSWKHASLPHVQEAGIRLAFGLDTPLDPTDPLHSLPRVIFSPTLTDAQMTAVIAQAPHPTTNGAKANLG
jgi:peptidoglycan/xylan/chitin deacetylase (PgdA/CDA1 family)